MQGALEINWRRRNDLTLAMTRDIEGLLKQRTINDIQSEQQAAQPNSINSMVDSYARLINKYFYQTDVQDQIDTGARPGKSVQPMIGRDYYWKDAEGNATFIERTEVENNWGFAITLRQNLAFRGISDLLLDEFEQAVAYNLVQGEDEDDESGRTTTFMYVSSFILEEPANLESIIRDYQLAFGVEMAQDVLSLADNEAIAELKDSIWRPGERERNKNLPNPYDSQFLNSGTRLTLQIGQSKAIDSIYDFDPVDTINIHGVEFQGENVTIGSQSRDYIRVLYPWVAIRID